MDSQFDSYHLWLGIPPHEQPPDAYRLLGIARFESNPSVIDNAVQMQSRHLATHENGPYAAEAARLIEAVRQSGAMLLNPQQKAQYDANLHAHLQASHKASASNQPVVLNSQHQRQPLSGNQLGILIACGVAAMILGLGGAGLIMYRARLARQRAMVKMHEEMLAKEREAAAILEARVAAKNRAEEQRLADERAAAERQRAQKAEAEKAKLNALAAEAARQANAAAARIGESTTSNQGAAIVPSSPTDSESSAGVKAPSTPAEPVAAESSGSAASGSPFQSWPVALELPSLLTKQPKSLAALADEQKIELALQAEFADLPEGQTIRAQVDPQDSRRWQLQLAKSDASKSGAAASGGVELAQLAHRNGELQFVWAENAPLEHCKQLQNCVLEIASDQHFRQIPLRKPINVDPLTLSLQKKIDVRILDLPNPPKAESLQLQVEALGQFPVSASWKDNKLEAKKGKYLAIQLTDYRGAEIRLKVDRKGRDQLALYVSPIFNPNARISFDLSLDRLEDMEKGTQRALLGAKRDIIRTNSKLSALKSRQSAINSQRPANALQQQAKATAQFEVQRDIASANRKIGLLNGKIVEAEARLKSLPEANQVVNKIHQQAQVRLQVVCVGKDCQLPLYVAKGG